jgi:hypothetical protein
MRRALRLALPLAIRGAGLTRVTRAALVACAGAALAVAAAYEGPRTFEASELLEPAQIRGPHLSVAPKVKTEGYLYVFDLTTDFGPLEAEGYSMLLVRLHEVGALAELDEVSKTAVFAKAAGTSVVNVGKGVVAALKDPEATAKGIGGGLERFGTNLGRKAKRATEKAVDAVAGDDDQKKAEGPEKSAGEKAARAGTGIAHSLFGVNSAARRWARKVGVDPYTTNPTLKKALIDLGRVDAAGGLVTKIVLPIPMVVSTTATVGDLVWSQDPEELLKINEQKLKEIGVGGDTLKQLYLSKGFTMTLHTRLATSLREVNVPGCADYVSTAVEADAEREALFFVEGAEMLARFHGTAPVAAVLSDSRALVAKTKDGRAVVLLPVDWVRWTEAYEASLVEIGKRAKEELGASRLELRVAGTMSAVAKKETAARGWTVVENVPSTLEVAAARAKTAAKK